MHKLIYQLFANRFILAGILIVPMLGVLSPRAVFAICTPTYTRETFRKVFRSNKVFFEALGDINGDGKLDAYGMELQPNNKFRNIVYVLNDGAGGFGDPVVINTSFNISTDRGVYLDHAYNSINIGSMNGDGTVDFVVRSEGSQSTTFYTLLSGAGGTYTESAPFVTGIHRYLVSTADLNGDNLGDLVINDIASFDPFGPGGATINALFFNIGNGDGTYGAHQPAGGLRELVSPVVGDLNADGKNDIAFSYWGSNSGHSTWNLRVLVNNGGAVFTQRPVLEDINLWLSGIADLNGDGRKDLFGGAILVNDGMANFTRTALPQTPAPTFPTGFINNKAKTHSTDFDGDGHKDILITINGQQSVDGMIKRYHDVYLNNGVTSISKAIINRPYLGLPADMNGDGKDEEVIFVNSTQGAPLMSPSNESAIIVRENVCKAPAQRGQNNLIDFGGDGISDIATWSPDSGQWHYLSNLEENSFRWGAAILGDIPIPGDYDGDGRTDAAVFRNTTGDWWILRSSDGAYTATHWGATGDIPIPGDYNGDGKADIAVFRPSDGNWYIWYTDTSEFKFLHFGKIGDIPIPRDFDGDGRDNIAVFRPESGDWFYLTSNFENFVGIHWGMTGDIPIPGDYDIDGKADIAVFRPGTASWYVFRSFDNSMAYAQYGQNGDVPMLVDSDGDGVMELSTYRTRTALPSEWYSSAQPLGKWGSYGSQTDRGLRRLLSNQ